MKAINMNRHLMTEVATFLMSSGEKAFWNTYLDNVDEAYSGIDNGIDMADVNDLFIHARD